MPNAYFMSTENRDGMLRAPVVYVIKLFGGNLDFPKIKKLKNASSDV